MTIQKTLKNTARRALNTPAFARLLTVLEQPQGDQAHLLRVLTYHRVDEPGAGVYPRIMVPPREFARQMQYVASRYNVIAMQDLVRFVEEGRPLPPRPILITFDDAYVDFAENAWPILRQLGLPATLFVPTAFPDHPERVFWWDRLYQALALADSSQEVDSPVGRLPLTSPAQREQAFSRLRD